MTFDTGAGELDEPLRIALEYTHQTYPFTGRGFLDEDDTTNRS
jgi:hypothetical protein